MRRKTDARVMLPLAMMAATLLAACGPASSSGSQPLSGGGSTTTIPRQHPSGGGPTYLVCGRPVSAPGEVSFVVGASAARLSAEVTVSALPPEHRCIALTSGANLHIRIGDRIQFVANSTPRFSNNLSNGGLFSVQTSPGPTATGALPTTHVIVTLTAVAPGSVTLGWTDCSGTAC